MNIAVNDKKSWYKRGYKYSNIIAVNVPIMIGPFNTATS